MLGRTYPRIASEDYDAFRRILNDHIPDTYDKWLYLASEKTTNLRGKGYVVCEVEVKPDKFARYCNTGSAPRNLHTLEAFSAEQARLKDE
jgi:hypothetical protein